MYLFTGWPYQSMLVAIKNARGHVMNRRTGPRTRFSHPHGRFGWEWPPAIAHSWIADRRPAWSCAQGDPFIECRLVPEASKTAWELPWVERSRMAMPAASIADALWYRRRPSGLREARIADRPWV
jgi:hypothetical protein